MQPNSITLAVDTANNGTLSNKEFTRFESLTNRSTYIGPGHTLQSRNCIQLYRTLPKRAGNFLGSAKTSLKLTVDVEVPNADGTGTIVAPMIVEVSYSIPVGIVPAVIVEGRQTVVAISDRDDIMTPFNGLLLI